MVSKVGHDRQFCPVKLKIIEHTFGQRYDKSDIITHYIRCLNLKTNYWLHRCLAQYRITFLGNQIALYDQQSPFCYNSFLNNQVQNIRLII